MLWSDSDTIAAIATPRGYSALGVVRVSGALSKKVLKELFRTTEEVVSKKILFGYWGNPQIDQVTVAFYEGGHGFTGEEAIEIFCHGNPIITEQILDSILKVNVRMARPGEFTYRAFLNNKMDLVQAESVLGMVHSQTPFGVKQALANLTGQASKNLEDLDRGLINILAHLEATIDFSGEDIAPMEVDKVISLLSYQIEKCNTLLERFERNAHLSKGTTVVLVGMPNVGKSSLFNLLVGKDRSIVSPIAGTTRDTVEAQILLKNRVVTLVDTAGVRNSEDAIEALGVERTKKAVDSADIVLCVADASSQTSEAVADELKENIVRGQKILFCKNKADLVTNSLSPKTKDHWIYVSCEKFFGLDLLLEAISKIISQEESVEFEGGLTTFRQKEGIQKIKNHLESCRKSLIENCGALELAATDLHEAAVILREILGTELNDDVLDAVFKEFCIGK